MYSSMPPASKAATGQFEMEQALDKQGVLAQQASKHE